MRETRRASVAQHSQVRAVAAPEAASREAVAQWLGQVAGAAGVRTGRAGYQAGNQ